MSVGLACVCRSPWELAAWCLAVLHRGRKGGYGAMQVAAMLTTWWRLAVVGEVQAGAGAWAMQRQVWQSSLVLFWSSLRENWPTAHGKRQLGACLEVLLGAPMFMDW